MKDLAGYNANRKVFDNKDDITSEIEGSRLVGDLPFLQKAVVVDILNDVEGLDSDKREEILSEIADPETFLRAPNNSIIGRITTRNQDLFDSTPRIFWPYNSQDAEPIMPGEEVFVFFVDQISSDQIGYWWKRVTQPRDSEEPNFTHPDRKLRYYENLGTSERFNNAAAEEKPGFDNGVFFKEERTLSGNDAYNKIQKNSLVKDQVVNEPVARFKKRPGDKVLQGSNASRIVLGLDRVGPVADPVRPETPAIDIVVGYGLPGTPTAPKTVQNTKNQLEVNKTPEKTNESSNPREGDPDFENDKTRLYASAKTNIDQHLNIQIQGIVPSLPDSAALAGKSDQIRFVAREDVKITVGNTALVIDQQGAVTIVSDNISLGSANTQLGVARQTDEVLIDGQSDTQFVQYLSSVYSILTAMGTALNGLGVPGLTPAQQGVPAPPATAKGKIITSSKTVKSD